MVQQPAADAAAPAPAGEASANAAINEADPPVIAKADPNELAA